jgi:hypothetical protein
LLRKEDVTFKGKEIHLKTDIIVFDTTNSDTWSKKIKPKDFEEKKYLLKNSILDQSFSVFNGEFYGNGHYIRGLYGMPLFGLGRIKNAVIQNLNISHSQFFAANFLVAGAGASIALSSINSNIRDCNVFADVYSGNGLFNVIIGTTIKNCSYNGNVTGIGNIYAGGIASIARKSSILDNNKVSGIIIGPARRTNGIVGSISSSSVGMNNDESDVIIAEKSGFAFGFETGYSLGIGKYGMSDFNTFNLYIGAIINRHFAIYLGYGLPQIPTIGKTNGIKYSALNGYAESVFKEVIENEKGLPKDDILYNIGDEFTIPIFVKPRFYLSEKSISPFIDADVGIALSFYESSNFYFNPSVGVQIKMFTVSLGYKIQAAQYQKLLFGTDNWSYGSFIGTYESGGIVKRPNGAISLKIGFGF